MYHERQNIRVAAGPPQIHTHTHTHFQHKSMMKYQDRNSAGKLLRLLSILNR